MKKKNYSSRIAKQSDALTYKRSIILDRRVFICLFKFVLWFAYVSLVYVYGLFLQSCKTININPFGCALCVWYICWARQSDAIIADAYGVVALHAATQTRNTFLLFFLRFMFAYRKRLSLFSLNYQTELVYKVKMLKMFLFIWLIMLPVMLNIVLSACLACFL